MLFGTIKQKPWVVDGEVIPRWVTTLGGSFDHRVVDGDLSARFMADVAAISKNPPCFWICSAYKCSKLKGAEGLSSFGALVYFFWVLKPHIFCFWNIPVSAYSHIVQTKMG